MPLLLLLLFIALPIAEIALLIKVADIIQLLPTIGLIIFTAFLGVYLLRLQGLNSIKRAQNALNEGRLPVDSVVDAVALLLSGAFLLTPGLITDSIGFLLLIPQVRHGLARYLLNKAQNSDRVRVDIFGMGAGGGAGGGRNPFDMNINDLDDGPPRNRPGNDNQGPIIDGEVVEPEHPADKDKSGGKRPGGKSPWRR